MIDLKHIWKSKWKILQGLYNTLVVKPEIEKIAYERMAICLQCPLYDAVGTGCVIPGTQPCCNSLKGGCGCKLHLLQRSLSSECSHPDGPKWKAVLTDEEQDELYNKVNFKPEGEDDTI